MGKYEEALERAKELHESGNALTKLQMEIVFPVLKEIEDERIRKAIGAAICGTTAEAVLEANGVRLADALTYLEKQKEQKPAEWGDEDEKIWVTISDLLWEGYNMSDKKTSWEKIRDWLLPRIKSIRPQPHWKPSEEQMKALGIAIRCGIQLGTWEEDALRSLNDELKKLL